MFERIARLLPCFVLLFLCRVVQADVAVPTETILYFERNGAHVTEPVEFRVSCQGYMSWPGRSEEPKKREEVFSFSGRCPHYGCTIQQNYYLNYRRIDSCDMTGSAGGKPFKITNYGAEPIDFSKCEYSGGQRTCKATFTIP